MFSCAFTLQCFASDSSAWGGSPHEFLTRITCFGKVYESNHILIYVEARLQGYVVLYRYFWKQGMGFDGRRDKGYHVYPFHLE